MSLEFHTLAMTTLMSQWTNLSSFETLLLGFMWMKCYNVEPVFPLFQCARCCRTHTRKTAGGLSQLGEDITKVMTSPESLYVCHKINGL